MKEWKVPSPPGRDACKGRVDANNVEHVCKCTENTFVTKPHTSLEGFTNGLAEEQKPRVSSSECADCNKKNPTTFVEGEKCRGLLCFKRCLGGKDHYVDNNKRTICTVCTNVYKKIRDQGKGIQQRQAYVGEYVLIGDNKKNKFYNDKFNDAYCARTKTFVEKPRSSERKLHDMYDETSSCCVCARAYVDPAVIADSYNTLPWTTNENGNDDLSKKLFPKWWMESRFAVASRMVSSTVDGIRKAMKKREMKGVEVQANTCHDCIRKITAVVVGAFEKANEDVNISNAEKNKEFFINAGADALKKAMLDNSLFTCTTPIPMEASCAYGDGDERRTRFVQRYGLPTNRRIRVVYIFQRTSQLTFSPSKKRKHWWVGDAYMCGSRMYINGKLMLPGSDDDGTPYELWIVACYYVKCGQFSSSLLYQRKTHPGRAELPGFLDLINDINALAEANTQSVHSILLNSAADLTGSLRNLREALRMFRSPERVHIVWKTSFVKETNGEESLGSTICVAQLLDFLAKQKNPPKEEEEDDDDDDEEEEEDDDDEDEEERIAKKNAGRLLERIHFERTKGLRGTNKSTCRSIILTHEGSKTNRSDSFNSLMEANTEHVRDKDGNRIIITAHVAQWDGAPIKHPHEQQMATEAFYNIKRRSMLYADNTSLTSLPKSHSKKTISRPLSPINGGESMR